MITLGAMMCSCTQETPVERVPVNIKYEVLTNEGNWYGEYISETGEKICICSLPLPVTGWTYAFTITEKPFVTHIDATSDANTGDYMPDVTTNIYVNDKLVATSTSNWAPGIASADIRVE